MGRRNDHSREQQREMAISAAELLLVTEGVSGFSMRKVAKAIGYTVGQLYLLFRNQDALFVVLNERTADAVHAALCDAIAPKRNVRAKLHAAAHAYIAFAEHHPNRWQLLYEHRLPDEVEVPRESELRIERLFGLIEELLREMFPAQKRKATRELAAALWSGVHGIAVLAVTDKLGWSGISNYSRLTDLLVDSVIDGFGKTGK